MAVFWRPAGETRRPLLWTVPPTSESRARGLSAADSRSVERLEVDLGLADDAADGSLAAAELLADLFLRVAFERALHNLAMRVAERCQERIEQIVESGRFGRRRFPGEGFPVQGGIGRIAGRGELSLARLILPRPAWAHLRKVIRANRRPEAAPVIELELPLPDSAKNVR